MFWAGVESGPQLQIVARDTERAVAALGVPVEDREFRPHLTLARIKHEDIRELREHIVKMTNLDFGTFRASKFQLFLSKTGPKGSVYSTLATYPLPAVAASQSSSAE